MRVPRSNITQLIRYAMVGLFLNLFGFLIYLVVTWLGMEPKLAVTVFYPLAVLCGYLGNRNFTFAYKGKFIGSGSRYIVVYLFGYCINLGILIIFVDYFGYAHQWVQAVSIFVVAAFLFFALKLFVFTNKDLLIEDRL
jgi:putative flippase GtrA